MEHDATTRSTGPLVGLRVLDLSNSPAGGQASQTLADFGAEVVHVEPPGGSPLRDLPSFPMIGRGKRVDRPRSARRRTTLRWPAPWRWAPTWSSRRSVPV